MLKRIFYNPHEVRLRSFWRIAIISSLLFSLMLFFTLISGSGYGFAILLAVAMIPLLWFASTKVDKRPFSEFGLSLTRKWFRDFLAGSVMGAAAMGVIVLISLAMGWMVVHDLQLNFLDLSFTYGLGFTLAVMIGVSVWEETYFRGYLITNLREGFSGRFLSKSSAVIIAVIISSIIFGLLHFGNPNASWISTLNISIAGLVFAYPYIVTKSLAIPVGMHLTWNYFQGAVFGLPVSGNQFEQMLMVVEITGPDAFTGGTFGPEAGAAGLLGLMVLLTLNEVYITLFHNK